MPVPTSIAYATMKWSAGAEQLFLEHTKILSGDERKAIVMRVEDTCAEFFGKEAKEDQIVIMRWVRDELIKLHNDAIFALQPANAHPVPPVLNSLRRP